MTLFTDDYFVLDFETGGFQGTSGFRPVEAALLRYRGGAARVWSKVVNPFDDPRFQINDGAARLHGITEDVARAGVPMKDAMIGLHDTLSREENRNLPVWAHNGIGFDFPLIDQEFARYGLPFIDRRRFRDSAALFKGRALGFHPTQGETIDEYGNRVLSTRRKGLYFSIDHITKQARLLPMTDDTLIANEPHLGISSDHFNELIMLGAHRAGYDVVVTHAIIQLLRKDPFFTDMFKNEFGAGVSP